MLYTDSCFSYLLALSFGIHGIFWSQRWLSHRNIWLSRLDASISTPLGSGVSRGGTFHLDPLETGLQARRPEDAGLECGIQRWKHNVGHLPWSMSMSTWIFWCWLVRLCVLIHDGWFHQCWSMIHFSITKKTNLLSIQCHKPSIGHSLAMLWWKTTHQMMMEHVFYNFFDISWHGGFLKWFEMGVPLQSSKSSDHFSIERWLGDLPFQETPIDP